MFKVTYINMAKGDTFETCIWADATPEQEKKFMDTISKIKKSAEEKYKNQER